MKKLRSLVRLDWKKGLMGLLAAAVLVMGCFAQAPKKTLLLMAVCVGAGFLKLESPVKKLKGTAGSLISLVCIFVTVLAPTVFLGEIGFNGNFFANLLWPFWGYVGNLFLVAIVCLAVYLFCGRWRLSVTLGTLAMGLFALVDGQICMFRGRELIWVDLQSLRTAMNVAQQYRLRLEPFMVFGIGVWAALVLVMYMLPAREKAGGLRSRLAAAAVAAAMAVTIGCTTADMQPWSWGTNGNLQNGFFLNFYLSFRNARITPPENYSPEAVARLGDGEETADREGELPNIIVIMSESYADLLSLNPEMKTNAPVTPFLDSLEENTIRGNVAVSIFGSNTPNSEFEFLTGHSMAWLPEGAIPYQYYVDEEIYALPWLMSELGYDTFATHPYLASGWSRTEVYPRLGFDGYSFDEAYPREDLLRGYISDREMNEYILALLENKSDAPLFLFSITMQNHGGYDMASFEETVRLENNGEHLWADQYLSLLTYTDSAMEYLLKELEDYPEDTVVLYFGDHLPHLGSSFYQEMQDPALSELERQMQLHTTPFFIWANYDIPEQTVECTSLSYLATYLLEAAGIELPPYYRFLKEMEQRIPVLSAIGYWSRSGGGYRPVSEAAGEEKQWLEDHAMAQYNNLFDGENRDRVFFGQYLGQS